MLKTNTKAVKMKVIAYIMQNTNSDQLEEGATQAQVFDYIAKTFINAEYNTPWQRKANLQEAFSWWVSGLPFNFADYHYNICAVDLVGDWLEQTKEERNKYSEDQAEKLADYLIFKALYNDIINNL